MLESPVVGDLPVARSPEFMWSEPREATRLLATRAIDEFGSLESWPRLGVSRMAIEHLRQGLLQ